jgi:hypothetical protein
MVSYDLLLKYFSRTRLMRILEDFWKRTESAVSATSLIQLNMFNLGKIFDSCQELKVFYVQNIDFLLKCVPWKVVISFNNSWIEHVLSYMYVSAPSEAPSILKESFLTSSGALIYFH